MSTRTKGFLITTLCFLWVFGFLLGGRAHAEEPFINITEPLNGTLFKAQSDLTLKGNTVPDSDIVLSTQDGEYAKLKSDSAGNWTYTIPTITEGSHTIVATVQVPLNALSSKTASANLTYAVGNPDSEARTSLAETGLLLFAAVPIGITLLVITIYTYVDYRRHKKPLAAVNPKVNYSFWHHIHMVSLPLLRYRLSINVDRRLPNQSDKIRRY